MKDYNKENLKRILALFASGGIVFLSVVTLTVSYKYWWASVPVCGIAIYQAVLLFKNKVIVKSKKEESKSLYCVTKDPKTGKFVKIDK